VYLYGWDRLPARVHEGVGIAIGVAGVASAFFVVAANGWMNDPTGFRVVAGKVVDVKPWAALFNSALWPEATHMILGAFIVAGCLVATPHAWALLHGRGTRYHRVGLALALTVAHHLNLAHGLGLMALREVVTHPDAKYSVTLNLQQLEGEGDGGAEAVRQIDAVSNRVFTDPMLKGVYPADLLADTAGITDWGFVLDGDLEIINQPIDCLGINYYFTTFVTLKDPASITEPESTGGTTFPGADRVEFIRRPGPYTTYGWTIDPAGLEDVLVAMSKEFPGLPLMVTENGAAFPDEVVVEDGVKTVHDPERVDFLRRHFTAARRAIDRGVDLRGYFVWSLLDNYEWNRGYAERFGIVRIDFETLERIPKDSSHWYSQLARTGAFPA